MRDVPSWRRPSLPPTNRKAATPMPQILNALVPIAIGAVAIVLLLGLRNMMRNNSANTSQKLMRWRVILQAVAIVVIMAAIFVRQSSG